MPMTLTRRFIFSAAHKLASPALDAASSAACYGPCERIHGHNYRMEVTVRGTVDPTTGFFGNVMELDRIVRALVVDRCDHRTLNDVDLFQGVIVTMENIAQVTWNAVEKPLAGIGMELTEVLVAETEEHWVRLTK
jgi:6-pyruvoyltetrahydropterin/6-carboxytetrahydropterin synthase